ncbi:hypothetical protein C3L33_20863, partial [Rhododendron williamsianum]
GLSVEEPRRRRTNLKRLSINGRRQPDRDGIADDIRRRTVYGVGIPRSSLLGSEVLEVGCGNSQLCEELYKDGITEITCIDLSAVAVEKMQKKLLFKGYKEIKVLEADMLDLPFGNECFDVVIEKGTMDVLFVDSGDPWNPQPATVSRAMAMLQGVHRVLKPDGIFISITFGQVFGGGLCTVLVASEGILQHLKQNLQGRRSSESNGLTEKFEMPSVSLFHDELETEDYLFRTNLDEVED